MPEQLGQQRVDDAAGQQLHRQGHEVARMLQQGSPTAPEGFTTCSARCRHSSSPPNRLSSDTVTTRSASQPLVISLVLDQFGLGLVKYT